MKAESLLLGVLGKDYGDGVFKYLDPRGLACLECTFTRETGLRPARWGAGAAVVGGAAAGE